MSLTQRQVWKTLRGLVSQNNNQIKKVFSGAVCAKINAKYYGYNVSFSSLESEKRATISTGLKSIYQSIGDNLTAHDYEAKDYYRDLLAQGKSWYDKLSVNDLLILFTFQNTIIANMNNLDRINQTEVVRLIDHTPLVKFFTGKVEFSGKPPKTPDDKQEFDETNFENISQALLIATNQAYNTYLVKTGRPAQPLSRADLNNFNFGRFDGKVARAYINAKLQALEEDQFAKNAEREQNSIVENENIEDALTKEATVKGVEQTKQEDAKSPIYTKIKSFLNPQPEQTVSKNDDQDEEFLDKETASVAEKLVGYDIQGSPVYESYKDGLFVGYTDFAGQKFSGDVFGRDDEDKEYFILNTTQEESLPTEDTNINNIITNNNYIAGKQSDVAISDKTKSSANQEDNGQLTLFELN